MSALLVMTGPGFGGLRADLAVAGPAWSFLVKVTNFLSGPGLFGLICLFPNGRFAPRWTKWLLLYLVAVFSPNSFFPDSPLAFGNLPGWVTSVFVFGPFLGSFFALPVYRYWRVFNAAERQQTKWAVLGFIAAFAGVVTTLIVAGPYVNVETLSPEVVLRGAMIQEVGYSLAPLLIPVFIGVAVLRSRLWDIDVIIRRTLVYSVLTALLALAYTGSIVVLQGIVQALTGQGQQPFVTVISTLAIAALFGPLRRRVQSFIDRRFYRRKYDAVTAIAAFAATARDEVDLGQLTDQLNEVVRQSLEPAHTALWLKGDEVSLSPPRV